jgi:hypothetical protein
VAVSSVELAIFESVLFKHPSELTRTDFSIDMSVLKELENESAKVQLTIDRLTELAADIDLQNVGSIKEKLKVSVKQIKLLQKKSQLKTNG